MNAEQITDRLAKLRGDHDQEIGCRMKEYKLLLTRILDLETENTRLSGKLKKANQVIDELNEQAIPQ